MIYDILRNRENETIGANEKDFHIIMEAIENEDYIGASSYLVEEFIEIEEGEKGEKLIIIEPCIYEYVESCSFCETAVNTDEIYYIDMEYIKAHIEYLLERHSNYYDNLIGIYGYDGDILASEFLDTCYYDNELDSFLCSDCAQGFDSNIEQYLDEYTEDLNMESFIKNLRHSYHYSKGMIRNYAKSNITLGFEVELEFTESIDSDMEAQDILRKYEDSLFYYESDGSLDEDLGMECVSNIIDMEYLWRHEADFREFFSIPIERSSRCGGHTHIGLNFIKNSNDIRDFFLREKEALMAISGRNTFSYCSFEYEDLIDYEREKFSAVHLKEDTLEFRFWGGYRAFETMIRRALITIGIVQLSNDGKLTLKSLYRYIEALNTIYEPKGFNFKWYLNKLSVYL